MCRDTTGLEESQSELWIHIAKENQKLGNMAVALNALNQAERVGGKSFYKEKAKWFAKNGFIMDAVRLVKANNPREVKQMDPYVNMHMFAIDSLVNSVHIGCLVYIKLISSGAHGGCEYQSIPRNVDTCWS